MSYTKPTISGYNASPPSDDGSTDSQNEITWAKHKTKLTDPLKTYADAINQEASDAWDDLSSTTDAAKGSTLVGVFLSVTGWVGRTLSSWISSRAYYAADFGVVADGTDYSTEMQQAMDTATADGKMLWLPDGIIGLANELTYTDYITMRGQGRTNTQLKALAGCTGTILSPVTGSTVIDATFKDFAINGNSIAAGGLAIGLDDLTYGGIHCTVDNVSAYSCSSYAMNFNKANNSKIRNLYASGGTITVGVYDTLHILFDYTFIQDGDTLFYVHGTTGGTFRDLYLFNDPPYKTTTTFLHIDNSYGNYFHRPHLEPQQSGGGYSLSELLWITDDGTTAERSVDNVFFAPKILTAGYDADGIRIGETAGSIVYKTRVLQGEFLTAGASNYDINLENCADTFLSRNITKVTYTTLPVSKPVIGRTSSSREYIEDYDDMQPELKRGVATLASGSVNVYFGAVDVTGDTDGSTGVITGMADTSDFEVGNSATVNSGFPSALTAYEILSKTSTTITLDTNSTSSQTNVTVAEAYFTDGNYSLLLTANANETMYCTDANKKISGFTITSSNGSSTADCNWAVARAVSSKDFLY